MVFGEVQFFERFVDDLRVVGTDPVLDDLVRRAQEQDLLRIVAALKTYRAKPRLKALAIEPFFDGVEQVAPDSILDYSTHGLIRPVPPGEFNVSAEDEVTVL